MKFVSKSLLILTLVLPAVSKTQPGDSVIVVRSGQSFQNHDTITYFAISRPRIEKLLEKAALADSLPILWQRSSMEADKKLQESETNASRWQWLATLAGAITIVELIILVVK
jgi:hypothetical protein